MSVLTKQIREGEDKRMPTSIKAIIMVAAVMVMASIVGQMFASIIKDYAP